MLAFRAPVVDSFPSTVPDSRSGCAPVDLGAALVLTFSGTVVHTIRLEYYEGITVGLIALKEYLC